MVYNDAIANSPPPSTPPRPLLSPVEGPSLSLLEPPPAARAVRRLVLEDFNADESQMPLNADDADESEENADDSQRQSSPARTASPAKG
jgi:hypothetical protein